jgi:hypothetical protein
MSGEGLNIYCQDWMRQRHQQSPAEPFHVGTCFGFTLGVVVTDKTLCVPDAADIKTVTDIVAQYLDQHPEARQYAGRAVVSSALSQAYPCPN